MSYGRITTETMTDIADAIRAKTGSEAQLTPAEMVMEIESIETSGGTAIADGIVVKARDANGYATEIDLYVSNNAIPKHLFRSGNQNNSGTVSSFTKVEKINVKSPVLSVGEYAFAWLQALREINLDFSQLTSIENYAFIGCYAMAVDISIQSQATGGGLTFEKTGITSYTTQKSGLLFNSTCYGCANLVTFIAPNITAFGQYTSNIMRNCTALETVQLGSVGNAIISWGTGNFSGCTQAGLTVTAYTNGSHVDALLSNIRNGATNATIIIKASEATEYNGTSYAAGDTILTSEVESTS